MFTAGQTVTLSTFTEVPHSDEPATLLGTELAEVISTEFAASGMIHVRPFNSDDVFAVDRARLSEAVL